MTKVLIGIPTYSGAQRVDWLLQSIMLRASDEDRKILQNTRIIICDDSAKREHQEKVTNVVNKWKINGLLVEVIINDKNVGVPTSWNNIIKYDAASDSSVDNSEIIILLNDDIIVSRDWLKSIIYFLNNNPKAGSVSPFCCTINECDVDQLLCDVNGVAKHRSYPSREQTDDFDPTYSKVLPPERRFSPLGCLFGFKRSIYDMVGGFDDRYFAYCDDYDFSTSVCLRGYPSYIINYSACYHIWGGTFGATPGLDHNQIFADSRAYYTKKWNGYFEITIPRYMTKIPFQKVKWICLDKEYEAVVEGEYGYHEDMFHKS